MFDDSICVWTISPFVNLAENGVLDFALIIFPVAGREKVVNDQLSVFTVVFNGIKEKNLEKCSTSSVIGSI